MKPITYITDCTDDNAKIRLYNKIATLFPSNQISFCGAKNEAEASLCLVDTLDALDKNAGIIFVNVAPRHGQAKKWVNGTPFGRVKFGQTNIYTTIDGYTLSLLQKLTDKKIQVEVYDIPATVPHFDLSAESRDKIINTQFRSLNYLPRLAFELEKGNHLPYETYDEVPAIQGTTCFVDCFGNIKTSLLPEEIDFENGKMLDLTFRGEEVALKCYDGLRLVPDGEIALTIGSSGLDQKRLLEIVKQGGSASNELNLPSGENIYIE